MDTLLRDAAMTPESSATPTAAHLMDAPLDQLLAEFSVKVESSSISDPRFTGSAFVRADGSLVFARPPARPAVEWEMMARFLLGKALRVSLPDLPEPYQITELE